VRKVGRLVLRVFCVSLTALLAFVGGVFGVLGWCASHGHPARAAFPTGHGCLRLGFASSWGLLGRRA
jgi:hypothetical protein